MSQKLPLNNFVWIKDTSKFNEDFIKTIIKKVMKDMFLNLMFNILKNYIKFIMIYHFYLRGNEDKEAKGTKKCFVKRKLEFENYENCSEATQLENKINHLEKNKIDADSIKIIKNLKKQ